MIQHTPAAVLRILAVTLSAPPTHTAGQDGPVPTPVLVPPAKVISLHRPSQDWIVVTTIVLAIQPTTSAARPLTFRWTSPNQNGTIHCADEPPTVREVAATVVEIGPSATSSASGTPSTGAVSEETVVRRKLVFRGEINYNAGINADRVGRFVEVGVVGRGSFTTALDADESFKEAVGRVLQVVPTDRSAYRWEGGVRLAVKRAHESDTTWLVKGNQLESATNIENAILLEFTPRADSAFSASGNDSSRDDRRRWAFRAELAPEIGILPGHQAPSFGFEVSRSFDGGPPAVKFLHGASLSASKGIFKQ
jgi:hypothetical protein